MWLPTPDAMVTRMLQAANATKDDLVYDLGAGDGKIPIAAAKAFGARSVGIEQQFQRIGGTLTIRGKSQPLLGAYVHGDLIGFAFVAPDGGIRSLRARVDGATLKGALQFSGNLTPIAGTRKNSAP